MWGSSWGEPSESSDPTISIFPAWARTTAPSMRDCRWISSPSLTSMGNSSRVMTVYPRSSVCSRGTYGELSGRYDLLTISLDLVPEPESTGYIERQYIWDYVDSSWTLSLSIHDSLYRYYGAKDRVETMDYSVYVTHPDDDEYLGSGSSTASPWRRSTPRRRRSTSSSHLSRASPTPATASPRPSTSIPSIPWRPWWSTGGTERTPRYSWGRSSTSSTMM